MDKKNALTGVSAQDKAGRAGHRRFRDNDIRHIEISKERKGRKELGGVAPRVRPTGVGGIGHRGIISRTMDTKHAG